MSYNKTIFGGSTCIPNDKFGFETFEIFVKKYKADNIFERAKSVIAGLQLLSTSKKKLQDIIDIYSDMYNKFVQKVANERLYTPKASSGAKPIKIVTAQDWAEATIELIDLVNKFNATFRSTMSGEIDLKKNCEKLDIDKCEQPCQKTGLFKKTCTYIEPKSKKEIEIKGGPMNIVSTPKERPSLTQSSPTVTSAPSSEKKSLTQSSPTIKRPVSWSPTSSRKESPKSPTRITLGSRKSMQLPPQMSEEHKKLKESLSGLDLSDGDYEPISEIPALPKSPRHSSTTPLPPNPPAKLVTMPITKEDVDELDKLHCRGKYLYSPNCLNDTCQKSEYKNAKECETFKVPPPPHRDDEYEPISDIPVPPPQPSVVPVPTAQPSTSPKPPAQPSTSPKPPTQPSTSPKPPAQPSTARSFSNDDLLKAKEKLKKQDTETMSSPVSSPPTHRQSLLAAIQAKKKSEEAETSGEKQPDIKRVTVAPKQELSLEHKGKFTEAQQKVGQYLPNAIATYAGMPEGESCIINPNTDKDNCNSSKGLECNPKTLKCEDQEGGSKIKFVKKYTLRL